VARSFHGGIDLSGDFERTGLALLEGFLFYLLAGFFTVRKGGGTYRGAWAGMWSGISSTIVFWLVFPLILIILLAQRIQLDTAYANKRGIILNFNQEFTHALQTVAPVLRHCHFCYLTRESLLRSAVHERDKKSVVPLIHMWKFSC